MSKFTVEYEIKIQCSKEVEAKDEDAAEAKIHREFERRGDGMIRDELAAGSYTELSVEQVTPIEEDEPLEEEEDEQS